MDKLSPRLYADLIGKPFVEGGRGPEAFDCLGLAIELQRRQGHDVPDFASTREEFDRECPEGRGILGPSVRIPAPVPGCVVLLRMLGDERHIGTMLDSFRMLHTMADRTGGAGIERMLDPAWQRRVLGYYEVLDGEPSVFEVPA